MCTSGNNNKVGADNVASIAELSRHDHVVVCVCVCVAVAVAVAAVIVVAAHVVAVVVVLAPLIVCASLVRLHRSRHFGGTARS